MKHDSHKLLAGSRVLVTRPKAQAPHLIEKIDQTGAIAISVPLLEIQSFRGAGYKKERAEIEAQTAAMDSFDDLVFVSRNAVTEACYWFAETGAKELAKSKRIFAVGEATASALAQQSFDPRYASSGMSSEALLSVPELQQVKDRNMLIIKGKNGRPLLFETLVARGARVSCCDVYQRFCPKLAGQQLRQVWLDEDVDAVLVSSGEILDTLVSLLVGDVAVTVGSVKRLVVPSARVAEKAFEYGFENVTIAENATDNAMVAALCKQSAI